MVIQWHSITAWISRFDASRALNRADLRQEFRRCTAFVRAIFILTSLQDRDRASVDEWHNDLLPRRQIYKTALLASTVLIATHGPPPLPFIFPFLLVILLPLFDRQSLRLYSSKPSRIESEIRTLQVRYLPHVSLSLSLSLSPSAL